MKQRKAPSADGAFVGKERNKVMKIETKYFGQIDIGEEKIIHFENGLLGFDEYKDYTIHFDNESEDKPLFSWLQSTEERALAFPIVSPFDVLEEYNPSVNDELLMPLGDMKEEDTIVFLMATIPSDIKNASVNMKAPLIINGATRKAAQIIVENQDYEIKHKIMKQEGEKC